jgi:hypothetical protein
VFIAVASLLLVGGAVVWLTVFRNHPKPQVEHPKTAAELIVGSWRLIKRPEERNPDAPRSFDIVYHFTEDGNFEVRVWDVIRGSRVTQMKYQLDGNTIKFSTTSGANAPTDHHEIWEPMSSIETLTEDELVIATITKKRWTLERAKDLALLREIPVEQVLAEVWEDRSREVFMRVKDE